MAIQLLTGFTLLLAVACLQADPMPRKQHDRTIVARVLRDTVQQQLRVQIILRLEVDTFTVVFEDLPKLLGAEELSKLSGQEPTYTAYAQAFAPILAANLTGSLASEPLEFTCTQRSYALHDEKGALLGHLRCDFVFESQPLAVPLGESFRVPLKFRDRNFELQPGRIRVSLEAGAGLQLTDTVQADEALQNKPLADWKPGEETLLRSAAAIVEPARADAPEVAPSHPGPIQEKTPEEHSDSLLHLLLDSRQGIFALLCLAAIFGAAHALTPGHGKTLVAAYLVGERGTAWHAVLLGLVTTVTHTGAVLLIAALLPVLFPQAPPRDIEMALKLGGGLLIAGLGFWLLLRRLSGGADHVHLPGTGHHHGPDGHTHTLPESVNWWGLIVLGISGGIIPCWDAIVMLGLAISAQRLWLGLPLLLAFSAGLASVLVIIGLAVVYLKGFASSAFGESRLVRRLPLLSAVMVTVLGLWLCYDGVHTTAASMLPSP